MPRSALDLIDSQPWAIAPESLETIRAIAARDGEGPEAVAARLGRPLQNARAVTVRDGVAVVPVMGPIFRYANLFAEVSGATSLEMLALDFTRAVDDPTVSAIVLEIDSPGGQATGIAEFAGMVRASAKPVTAYVGGIGASAAYWIAAAAHQVVVSTTAELGSVGAVLAVPKGRAQKGVEVAEFVSSQSPAKRPDPDSDAGRAELQSRVDDLASVFIADVARYRGTTEEAVMANFGRGGVRIGEKAVKAGMADRLGTLESVIAGLSGKRNDGGRMATTKDGAGADRPDITRAYLAEHHPDLVAAIADEARAGARAEGETAERQRVTALLALPLASVHAETVRTAIAEGASVADAAMAILRAEEKGRADHLQQIRGERPKPLALEGERTDTLARAEGSNPAVAKFESAVSEAQATGLSRGKAIAKVVAEQPNIHAAYIAAINGGQR